VEFGMATDPAAASRGAGTFFRVALLPDNRLENFKSYAAMGKPLIRATPEALRRSTGYSVYLTHERARRKALDLP
jgi:hypothetical protein